MLHYSKTSPAARGLCMWWSEILLVLVPLNFIHELSIQNHAVNCVHYLKK